MNFDFTYSWHAPNTFRAQSVIGSYDLRDVKLEKRIKGSIPIEDLNWQIGVITGLSGSGKTSIAKRLAEHFKGYYFTSFTYEQPCFLDDFPTELQCKEVETALNSAGFSEPPSWLKSYNVLSTGQKMRVDVARALCCPEKLVVFDEFTSVVDRTVAQIGSYAISKNVRRHPGKQFVAVTCHSDVVDWLEPDWMISTDTMEFTDFSSSKKKECIRLLTSQSIGAIYPCGRSLGNITI